MVSDLDMKQKEGHTGASQKRGVRTRAMDCCPDCDDCGVVFDLDEDFVRGKMCGCAGKDGFSFSKEAVSNRIELLNHAMIPSKYLRNLNIRFPREAETWLKLNQQGKKGVSLVLHGAPGSGKTTVAAILLAKVIVVTGKSGRFIKSDDFVSYQKNVTSLSFGETRDSLLVRAERYKDEINQIHFVVFDDIGRMKTSETNRDIYIRICDGRYELERPTIYTTNHWQEDTDEFEALKEKIGIRSADRMREAICCDMGKVSLRPRPANELALDTVPLETEVIDMEKVKNFQTTGIAEGQTTSPFFVAQNPIFQLVSDKERAEKTDAEGRDVSLPERRYRDIWNKGDDLTMVGYLLCQNDMMVLVALLEIWHDYHRSGGRGVSFCTTISSVRKKMGLKSDKSSNTNRIIRSIKRLGMTKIQYIGHNREMFIGGFVDAVHHKSATSQSQLSISLNPYFIKFYEKLSFFRLNMTIPSNLSYQARLLYVFLESQPCDALNFPLSQLAKLYGKSESAANNRNFRESVRDALLELKSSGLQGEESQLDKNGIVSTRRVPISPSPIALSC